MRTLEDLKRILRKIDKKGYKAYREIEGVYDFRDFSLIIEHVQSDPFAPPSLLRARVPMDKAGFPTTLYSSKSREVALRDYLTREFSRNAASICKGIRGTGRSGLISIDTPLQEILERTSVILDHNTIEARFYAGMPARGRSVMADVAEEMLSREIPSIIRRSLFYTSLDHRRLDTHIETSEDADHLRTRLHELGLVAFVSDGAILPRASGIDPRPMRGGGVIPFRSPESLRVEVELPNRGRITGMGIPEGITLIVGGGYHGKSTLLDAIKLGVYNHIPGDGREFVVTVDDAVMIRSEDGRSIRGVDISPFISNLPFGIDTRDFSTDDASGSTSQAANIMEALEAGTGLLLIDEDTSATNFIIRDHRMQELVSKDHEPITPFIDKVRLLYRDLRVSTILVMGGSGDYFDVADTVICMKNYTPVDVTARAREIAERYRTQRRMEGGSEFGIFRKRIPLRQGFDPSRGRRDVKISSKGLHSIAFGRHTIDLDAVEQIVHVSQTRAIGDAILYATRFMDGRMTMRAILELVMKDIRDKGLDVLTKRPAGDYAMFRRQELSSAINRLRTLRVLQGL
jgi:predicted ABC-class ATPase